MIYYLLTFLLAFSGARLPEKYQKWLDEEVVYIISEQERADFRGLTRTATLSSSASGGFGNPVDTQSAMPDVVNFATAVPLTGFAPGECTVQVQAIDHTAKKFAFQRAGFTILDR